MKTWVLLLALFYYLYTVYITLILSRMAETLKIITNYLIIDTQINCSTVHAITMENDMYFHRKKKSNNYFCRHEIVGEVTNVGCNVTKFKVGDRASVGCMVGSCGSCNNCKQDLENYCPKMIWTYNGQYHDGLKNFGGYSDKLVVDEHFAVLVPNNLPLAGAAPLVCAGITVYSPMMHYGLSDAGQHLGVVGLGGLGHLAVKFAKALGMKVTVISTSPSKQKEAVERLGVDEFLLSHDQEKLQVTRCKLPLFYIYIL